MEALLRFGVFFGILSLMALWEALSPARRLRSPRRQRWSINLGLAALNAGVMRLSIGAAAWLAANWAIEQRFGLFNNLPVPVWLNIALSLLLLDLAIYAQHVAAHRWQWFWRLHQVHHSDLDFDATTAVRFHPLEIMLSMAYKVLLVIALGAEPLAVIAFEIILNGCALFNHGNVSLRHWPSGYSVIYWSRRTCTGFIIPPGNRKPTAIMAFRCRAGTVCSRPTVIDHSKRKPK